MTQANGAPQIFEAFKARYAEQMGCYQGNGSPSDNANKC